MKKLILLGFISTQVMSTDLIFKNSFENNALVGGVVTGLVSTDLELNLSFNSTNQTLVIASNGTFIFDQEVPFGVIWTVSIQNQPSNPTAQICTLSNASGTMTPSGVNNIQITCPNLNKWDVMKWDEGSWQ